ncbi:Rhodanese-like protein [Acaromyces ingoldii]|uniref:Rhodanese-like protein n=1 Tax=Acaromyces ingoldii TaxID=215250 RepID=A0A316YZI4_9BASI|nr:Rhodanese-like protein [Acaromyces ingoldii]PWN94078.1 Rhodanese-like protein [Acaromyces ingoldii]
MSRSPALRSASSSLVAAGSRGAQRRVVLASLAPAPSLTQGGSARAVPATSVAATGLARPSWATRAFHCSPVALSRDTNWVDKGDMTYKELKPITQAPTGQETIIDVREPDEVQAGMIPSAVNVPLSAFAKAFDKNGGVDFEKDFAFPRPAFDDKVVFYCRSGKRSQQALELARKNGWWNSRNYRGSWLDWVQQEDARKQ